MRLKEKGYNVTNIKSSYHYPQLEKKLVKQSIISLLVFLFLFIPITSFGQVEEYRGLIIKIYNSFYADGTLKELKADDFRLEDILSFGYLEAVRRNPKLRDVREPTRELIIEIKLALNLWSFFPWSPFPKTQEEMQKLRQVRGTLVSGIHGRQLFYRFLSGEYTKSFAGINTMQYEAALMAKKELTSVTKVINIDQLLMLQQSAYTLR